MINRVFTNQVRNDLTCKPGYGEIGMVSVYGQDCSKIPLIVCEGSTRGDAAIHRRLNDVCADTELVEFAVLLNDRVYLINTEGYDYARFAGYLCQSDSESFLEECND